MKSFFPGELHPPTVEERERFYEGEFDMRNVKDLSFRWEKPVFAFDIGTESTRYKPRFKKYKGKVVFIREYDDFKQLQRKFVRYAPEDLYYDLKTYDRDPRQTDAVWERPSGQQLVFDLDPELIECRRCRIARETNRGERLARYTFCEDCFSELAEETAKLHVFLERHFEELRMFFSGRGFHIHVRDQEGFEMDAHERMQLASKLAQRFPIDERITAGKKTMIRLPGSLHGLTGRKVVPVTVEEMKSPLHILYEKSEPEVF